LFAYLKPFYLGLDINADEIRLVALSKKRKVWRVESFSCRPLPRGAITDGKIRQFEIVQAALNQLVKETRARGCRAVIALPANSVISKRISLSASLNHAECEAEISANVHKYFPGMSDELCFDFLMLDSFDKSQHDILLVASRKEQLNAYIAITQASGLKIRKVDVDSHALMRAGNFILPLAETIAVLDVAVDMTQLLVFQRQNIIYSQQWQTLDSECLEAQVRRALQLCLSSHPDLQIKHLMLAGKTGELNLDVEMIRANPFLKMLVAHRVDKVALHAAAPRFLVSCGLALRGFAA
jgi:type IV pilus assembly protein PilM